MQHDKHEKRATLLALWLVGLLLVGFFPLIAPNVGATSGSTTITTFTYEMTWDNWRPSGNTYDSALFVACAYDSSSPGDIDYCTFIAINLTAAGVPAGATITGAYMHMYTIYFASSGNNKGMFFQANTTGYGANWPPDSPPHPPGYHGSAISFDVAAVGYWQNVTITSLVAADFTATGVAHLMLASDSGTNEYEWDSSSGGSNRAHMEVTWTAPSSGQWAPTFTSSPITSGTAGVSYAYHATLNESANMSYLGNPAWLSLTHNNTGGPWYLNGTPPSAGSYAVHLRAHSDAGTLYSYQNFTIVVAAAPVPGAFIITSSPVTNGIVGVNYTYHVTANQSVSAWNVSGAGSGSTSGWLNLEPAADTYVSSANPSTNYGSSTGLIARYDYPSIEYNQVFLRWNVSTLPVGAVIDHAYLNLYQYAHSGSDGDVTLTENAITDWKETAITYNNQPAQLDYVHVANQYTLGWKNYTDAKLDAWVAAQCSASSKVSLGFLRSASGATVYDTFYSQQYTSKHPYLSIHYTVASTSWLTFDSNGYLNGTPLTAGTYSIHVMATNSTGAHAYQNYTLTIKSPWAPTFTNSPATTGLSSHLYTYTPSCNESVTYTIYYVPANPWASFIGNVLSGAPTSASTWAFNLQATSTAGTLSAWKNWTLVITAAWNPHFTSSPDLTVLKLHAYLYNFVCNESCSFTTDTKPSWASAGASSVSGTPPVGGYFAFVIHATNSQGGVAYQYWNVTVLPLPFPAFTSTPNQVAILHVSYSYTVSTDITCVITITDAPSWLHYSATTHKLTGVCPYNGVFAVTLCATSTLYGTQQNQSFSIVAAPTVVPLNVDQQWLAIIPLLILLALIIICCISREEGFSTTMFMGTLAIGIALLVWTETMPVWTIVVTAAIIGLMVYREVR